MQLPTHATFTNPTTHELIHQNMHQVPVFLGNDGKGQGPRYCVSIEGKIRRFADRDSHRVWVEQEGLTTDIVYPNGLSTGFPAEVKSLCLFLSLYIYIYIRLYAMRTYVCLVLSVGSGVSRC